MADDLVRRLRELDTWVETAHTPVEAADRIEALERERREAALDALAAMGQAQEAYEAQLKAEATVATLTAQMEALRGAAEEVLRISDRDHQAWHRLRAEIAKIKETAK